MKFIFENIYSLRILLNGSAALVGPGFSYSFLIYSQSVGLLGRVISSWQGLYVTQNSTNTE
jgi:hypothetical protein